jgi:hypothetical protein
MEIITFIVMFTAIERMTNPSLDYPFSAKQTDHWPLFAREYSSKSVKVVFLQSIEVGDHD